MNGQQRSCTTDRRLISLERDEKSMKHNNDQYFLLVLYYYVYSA